MQDAVALWQALLGEESPPTVFVGHSMGGAIATWAASRQVRPQPHSCHSLMVANHMLSCRHLGQRPGSPMSRSPRRAQQAEGCMRHAGPALLKHQPSCLARPPGLQPWALLSS